MNYDLGENDYRRAGRERLKEGWILLQDEMFAGSVYLSGRAVEAILRALIWKHDPEIKAGKKSLDTGHDLRVLLERVTNLGVLREKQATEMRSHSMLSASGAYGLTTCVLSRVSA